MFALLGRCLYKFETLGVIPSWLDLAVASGMSSCSVRSTYECVSEHVGDGRMLMVQVQCYSIFWIISIESRT
jgi:hypothetical protein